LTDSRKAKDLTKGLDESPISERWTTLREAGVQTISDASGKTCRVLWAPQFDSSDNSASIPYENGDRRGNSDLSYTMIFLEGPDKGCVKEFNRYDRQNNLPMFQEGGEITEGDDKITGEKPKAGKAYMLWLPESQTLWGPLAVATSATKGGGTCLNFDLEDAYGATCRVIIRPDIDVTTDDDFTPTSYGEPRIVGADVVFVPIKATMRYREGPETPANIYGCRPETPTNFIPLTLAKLNKSLGQSKKASVEIGKDTTGAWIKFNGELRAEALSTPQLAVKLARDLRLHADEATERALAGPAKFELIRNAAMPKIAAEMFKEAGVPSVGRYAGVGVLGAAAGGVLGGAAGHFGSELAGISNGTRRVLERLTTIGGMATGGALAQYLDGQFDPGRWDSEGSKLPAQTSGSDSQAFNEALRKAEAAGEKPSPELFARIQAEHDKQAGLLADTWDAVKAKGQDVVQGVKDTLITPAIQGFDGDTPAGYKTTQPKPEATAKQPAEDKKAHAYFDQELDPDTDFDEYDYDSDLQLPVEASGRNRHMAQVYHEQQERRVPRYRDAQEPQGGRNSRSNLDHIPDDVILRMANPGMEMARLGEELGMGTLIDHGAVGSLAKVFDATPFITDYVGQLEGSLDHLARLLFMLFWKPRDFGKMFGNDDLPQLENKLTGVFTSYGDLVLELLQTAGGKTD
jgi:hypothetical protein